MRKKERRSYQICGLVPKGRAVVTAEIKRNVLTAPQTPRSGSPAFRRGDSVICANGPLLEDNPVFTSRTSMERVSEMPCLAVQCCTSKSLDYFVRLTGRTSGRSPRHTKIRYCNLIYMVELEKLIQILPKEHPAKDRNTAKEMTRTHFHIFRYINSPGFSKVSQSKQVNRLVLESVRLAHHPALEPKSTKAAKQHDNSFSKCNCPVKKKKKKKKKIARSSFGHNG